MSMTHVIGVDPGLVHTGVVSMKFLPITGVLEVRCHPVVGLNTVELAEYVKAIQSHKVKPHIFIEAYRPRSNLNSDVRMVNGVQAFRQALPGSRVLQNTGVKQVVKQDLMELLGVWKFSTVTNHQDLRSAARIALFGMLKDPEMNELIADIVRDHLEGKSWDVRR